jgi:ATP-binding cassette subfamily B protein
MSPLSEASWPTQRAAEALSALARAAGLPIRPTDPPMHRGEPSAKQMERWVERTATWLGLEAEPIDTSYAELDALLRGAGPVLICLDLPDGGGTRFVALLEANARRAVLVGPGGRLSVSLASLREAVVRSIVTPALAPVERMLDLAQVKPRSRAHAREAILRERIGVRRVGGFWILRRPASAPLLDQLRGVGAHRDGAALLVAHLLRYAIVVGSWWTIGRGVLQGHLDPGWMVAWGVLLVTQIPLHLLELRAQGRLSIEGASVLKRRLMQGALALAPEEMRGEGAGQLLGRTLETSALESLVAAGGFGALMALIDFIVSAGLLAATGGALPVLALGAWSVVGALVARGYVRARGGWTDRRLALTHDLVERMVGHRTRMAQQPASERHAGEDEALTRYFSGSIGLDRANVVLTALLPAGWMLIGLAALIPKLVSASTTPGELAGALGAVLLSFQALKRLTAGFRGVAAALVAWRRVAPLFIAGGRTDRPAAPELGSEGAQVEPGTPVLTAHDLVFRYRPSAEPALRGCSMRIVAGDRVLLEGPSGGGKSTLSLLLAGVRAPESGTLLVGALDRHTLGSLDWRRRVLAVPQFHENHVLSATFAFNVLMGRDWPPVGNDLLEAESVCRELGLGDLLDRMPGGLQQMVGETGWQLSHGERSRLFIARALLQSPDVLVLDESFAALDPETMQVALGCVLKRAPALIVVAHP